MSEIEAVPEVTILNVNSSCSKSIKCTVKVSIPESESQDFELIVDTGSPVSILPESVVTEYFPEASFKEPELRLRDYVGIL